MEKDAPSLSSDDYTRILIVSNMRPSVCVQRSRTRACGYIIRAQIKISNMNGRIAEYLTNMGLKPREVYTKTEELNRVLRLAKGLEEFVHCMESLEHVKALNGRIKQPTSHLEVLSTLEQIETILSNTDGSES